MNDATNWLVHDHRRYEAALEACELAAAAGLWKDAIRAFDSFVDDLKLHMRLEDEVLYPFFVEEVGDPDDAIGILSEEHDDLARLLGDLTYVIKANDFDHFEDSLVPLREAMVQHNTHEEEIFRRMNDDVLLQRRDDVVNRLNALKSADGRRHWDF